MPEIKAGDPRYSQTGSDEVPAEPVRAGFCEPGFFALLRTREAGFTAPDSDKQAH